LNTTDELHRTLKHLLEDDTARTAAGDRAARFVQSNIGATDRFLEHLERRLGPHVHELKQQ
jgi:3-deoxy-D-manno-octulosonic-acid transferase